jgi:hypothetical protein
VGSNGSGSSGVDSIVIMFNDGWGNLEIHGFEANSGVFIYCEDMNNDGYPDIISRDGDSIFYHENNQASGLGDEIKICHTLGNRRIGGIADMDTNGYRDILFYGIANPRGWGITYNLGSSQFNDSFLYPSSSGSTVRVCLGDLNNDTIPDILATSNLSAEGVSVYYNNITDFEESIVLQDDWLLGFISDVDIDGINDINVIKYSSVNPTRIQQFKNDIHSFIDKGVVNLISGSDIECVTDFDLDGFPDLACVNHGDESLPYTSEAVIYLNNTDWNYNLHHEHYIGEWFYPKLFAGDINMDGYPDLVAVGYLNPTRDHIQILWNDREGGFIDTNNVYVSINEKIILNEVTISPNPSRDQVFIHSLNYEIVRVSLVDISGEMILNEKQKQPKCKVEFKLTNIIPGVYILLIELQNNVHVINKLIIH